ncbi:adenosylcobalamin-dependent ribonucleoside-diphosphate reductase [Candidatus Microgenomates bacterium]|nr:adenosylcobalamin-dependent ribonucleoside-diphosphate reductase [Candidatus Microgenomates bacterium]
MKIIEPKLSSHAQKIVQKRYLRLDHKGKPCETPGEMFWRVSKAVAKADAVYDNLNLEKTARQFYELMINLLFLPAGRALFEAGNDGLGQLSSCFVLPIEDNIASIFGTLGEAAVIQKNNGGTGFNFSKIRPHGDRVKNVPEAASGPVDFLRAYDGALGAILQGSKRHGGNMAILNCDHPDILDFIDLKGEDGVIRNFNISVGVTDEFMEAAEKGKGWQLINPRNGEVVQKISARKILDLIAKKAHEAADPGVVFLDRLEKDNPTPTLGRLDATNPCGEQPLLPYESCNLGSIILSTHLKGKTIDWPKLRKTVHITVHFLDNMIDVNLFPLEKIEKIVKFGNRKIGLGIMGFAHLLYKMGLPYDSEEAVKLLEKIMAFIQKEARQASTNLAKERGVFPNFDISIHKDGSQLRNATMLTIAPTGTISMLASTSSGIEPVFSLVTRRQVLFEETRNKKGGQTLTIVDSVFEEALSGLRSINKEKVLEQVAQEGTVKNVKELPAEFKRIFVTAHDISWKYHVKMQAACQKYCDNSVSKTINFPSSATVDDVKQAFLLAWRTNCKGITIYRDKSRKEQVLSVGALNGRKIVEEERGICPECGGEMEEKEGCFTCPNCGYSYCKS